MAQKTHPRLRTLAWAFRGLLALFAVIALLIILGVLGIAAIGAFLLNPILLIVIGIAIVAIYVMMKNPREVR